MAHMRRGEKPEPVTKIESGAAGESAAERFLGKYVFRCHRFSGGIARYSAKWQYAIKVVPRVFSSFHENTRYFFIKERDL